MRYGIPYQGSKSKIAKNIISVLPNGNRFVDLFGGGFAMSHCALLSRKYNKIYYNDINPLLSELIQDAIDGKYDYKAFKPKFISREEFFEKKDTDGHIKYIWSFGNAGRAYIYSPDIEKYQESIHNFIVFGEKDDFINSFENIDKYIDSLDIRRRRLQWKKYFTSVKNNKLKSIADIYIYNQIEREESLERYERLQNLESLKRYSNKLELHCGNYKDYVYQDGDVVYCDPPYEDTMTYGSEFNHKEFYDWVYTRPYEVYFSSYDISDDRFYCVYELYRRSIFSATDNTTLKLEKIYCNKQKEKFGGEKVKLWLG